MLRVIPPLTSTLPVSPPRTLIPTALSTSVAEIEAPESTVTLLLELRVTPAWVDVGLTVQLEGSSMSDPPVEVGPDGQAAKAAPASAARMGPTATAVTRALFIYRNSLTAADRRR